MMKYDIGGCGAHIWGVSDGGVEVGFGAKTSMYLFDITDKYS